MTDPPFTSKDVPVIKQESSDAKKSTARATSSGVPNLPIGVFFEIFLIMSFRTNLRNVGVSVVPGRTELTFTYGANSIANWRVSAKIPALDTA